MTSRAYQSLAQIFRNRRSDRPYLYEKLLERRSELNDRELLALLVQLLDGQPLHVAKLLRADAAKRKLTTKEKSILPQLIEQAFKSHHDPVNYKSRNATNLKNIHVLFDRAEKYKKSSGPDPKQPKVHLGVAGIEISLRRSKAASSKDTIYIHPVKVTSWLARIPKDNRLEINAAMAARAYKHACEALPQFLETFAKAPAQVAADYGHRTGRCCFCQRDLSDKRSVDVGYGPICAEKWGLPWG